jgi:hypothetical protein
MSDIEEPVVGPDGFGRTARGAAGEVPMPRGQRDALAALLRWEASGAAWRLHEDDGTEAVVDLLTCDGGDVVGRLTSADPRFVGYVRAAGSPSGG